MHLPGGQRLEQGTSEARETCRRHVLVPACVWRPGWAASEPRRPLQKITPSQQGGVFLHLPAGQRLEQGTSEARETCRGHVLVPACVWRSGRAPANGSAIRGMPVASRASLRFLLLRYAGMQTTRVVDNHKETPSFRMVFLCIYRAAGDVLTVMQAAQKRRISTTLLSCSEDGAREHYSIICCTFSFSLQPLCQWLHRR